jgi:hypothetical protein
MFCGSGKAAGNVSRVTVAATAGSIASDKF